jgi:hypothetical protein
MFKPISKSVSISAFIAATSLSVFISTVTARAEPIETLAGTWRVQCDGFFAYETYTASGALSAIDNQSPPSQQTLALGSWRMVGERRFFEDQYQMIFDAAGVYQGTLVIHAEDIIDESGTKILPSPYSLDFVDPTNTVTRDIGSGYCTAIKLPAPRGPARS